MLYPKEKLVIKKRGGGERTLAPYRWFIDQNTPVGEDADFYEVKPFGGRRRISRAEIVRRAPITEE